MTKHLAPSAGSKLMACMTKSDLISLSVRHFKSRRVKALSAHAEGKSVRQNSAIEGGNWVGGGALSLVAAFASVKSLFTFKATEKL